MLTIGIILVSIFIFFITRVKYLTVIENDSIYLSNSEVTDTLINPDLENKNLNIKPEKVEASELVYYQAGTYYINEVDKRKINTDYPLYYNNNLAIRIITPGMTLINKNLEKNDGYSNMVVTNGTLFNYSDQTQADNETYILIENKKGIYINTKPIIITTTTNKYEIPINSIVYMSEEVINYYSYEKEMFIFHQIKDIDLDSKIKIEEKEYSYETLLTKLGKLETEKEPPFNFTPEEDKKEEEEIKEEKPVEENKPENIGYVKPSVKVEEFKANVYSIKSNLSINDPAGRITTPVTFTLKTNNKLYLRKSYVGGGGIEIPGLLPSTEFEIEGTYAYKDENNKIKEVSFFKQTLTTKGIEELEKIVLGIENGNIYSNKIELKTLNIQSELNSETLKGVKRAVFKAGEEEFKITSTTLIKLLQGKTITYQTPEKLKSNTDYEYEIELYDGYNNLLPLSNNKGYTKTSKEAPSAKIKVDVNDIGKVDLKVELTNKDEVSLHNYRYEVKNTYNQIVDSNNINSDGKIKLYELDPNQTYEIEIYSDYDLNDGKGTQTNKLIGKTSFITMNLTSLGYLNLNTKEVEVKTNEATLSFEINKEATDTRLLSMLDNIEISLLEEDEVIYQQRLNSKEKETLLNNEILEKTFNNLKASTTYKLEIKSILKQGTKEYKYDVIYSLKSFETTKREAKVTVKNQFVTENMIDFDVQIEDLDNAIEGGVTLEVRNELGKLVQTTKIKTNQDFERITYDKLTKNTYYTFKYIASGYNVGTSDSTYENNKVLHEYQVYTEEGISGEIKLSDLKYNYNKYDNLIDLNETKVAANWLYDKNQQNYEYDVKRPNEITFTIKKPKTQNNNYYFDLDTIRVKPNTEYIFYAEIDLPRNIKIGDHKPEFYNAKGNKSYYAQSLTTNQTNIIAYKITTNDDDKYVRIRNLFGNISSNYPWQVGDKITYKNIMFREYDETIDYKEYIRPSKMTAETLVTLTDKRDEIQTNDYYIKVLKDNKEVSFEKYEFEDKESVKDLLTKVEVEPDASYVVELYIKIRDRYYLIDKDDFTSESEIRGIKTVDDFLVMDFTEGSRYYVVNDLDFRNTSLTYGRSRLNALVDFRGHTLYLSTDNRDAILSSSVGSNGTIKNLVLDITANNRIDKVFRGMVNYNYGLFENIMINVHDTTKVPNYYYSLLIGNNMGILKNFVVNYNDSFYGTYRFGSIVDVNSGTVKNGYVYGEPFVIIDGTGNHVGPIVGYSSGSSKLENIYSLVNIRQEINKPTVQAGNISGHAGAGVIKNGYSVGVDETIDISNDPNAFFNINKPNNLFYIDDKIFNTTKSKKTSTLSLYDKKFQNSVLNEDNAFNVDELVDSGYYPQLKIPDCMPDQEYIELPEIEDVDLPDVIKGEVIEQTDDTAKIEFSVYNPNGEKIKDISIANLTTKILEQNYSNGNSIVIAEVSNPKKYVSSYEVQSLTTTGSFNIDYTRTYKPKERVLNFELYRSIRSMKDWKLLETYPTENFKLHTDLDFINESPKMITLTGKLDGQNHTIKNIFMSNTASLFNLSGATLTNLNVINFKSLGVKSGYSSFVMSMKGGSIINNVHIDKIYLQSDKYVGGLVGQASESKILNSSVSNLSIKTIGENSEVYIGGLISYSSNVNITSCYTNNVNLDASKINTLNSIGGLVGYFQDGSIINTYSHGKIISQTNNVGGLVGYGNPSLENSYSMVDIDSSGDFVGGILGSRSLFHSSVSDSDVVNSLSLGNLYIRKNIEHFGRTIGDDISLSNNYALSTQLINGRVEPDFYNETLIDIESLKNISTYRDVIGFGDNFSYEGVEKGILPKLVNSETGELLPNQEDIYLPIEEFEVIDHDVVKRISDATVTIKIDNPNNYPVEKVEFDYLNVDKIIKNNTVDGITTIELLVKPEKSLDNYKLTKVVYKKDDKEISYEKEYKIDMQFYKDLEDFEDWQKIDSEVPENYRLVADIDFEGKVNINDNVSIARLEGTDEGHTLKNFTKTYDSSNNGLIKIITTSMKNVTFENIHIESTVTTAEYINIINTNYGNLDNIILKDIYISAPKNSYVSSIGLNKAPITNNITLENIEIYGNRYVSGFSARGVNNPNTNINISNVNISANNDYVGSYQATKEYLGILSNYNNFKANNITVTGNNYVGGLFGVGGANNVYIEEIDVRGMAYVGGIAGNSMVWQVMNNVVKNATVNGATNVGGAYADGYSINNMEVIDSLINGINSVGGVVGKKRYEGSMLSVINSEINGDSSVGGLVGEFDSGSFLKDTFVFNSKINGVNKVGGLIGEFKNGEVFSSYVQSNVNSTESDVGSIIGYVNNTGETEGQNKNFLYQIYASTTVTGNDNIGVIGRMDKKPLDGRYYGIIDASHYSSDNPNAKINATIASNPEFVSNINNFLVYDGVTINGEKVDTSDKKYTGVNFVSDVDLRNSSTYTNAGYNNSYWDFTPLNEGYFPKLKNVENQEGVLLPVSTNNMLMSNYMFRSNSISLPSVKAYASGVDSVNIELSEPLSYGKIEIEVGKDKLTLDGSKRVYTFKYDFNSNIKVTLKVGSRSISKTFNTNDLRKTMYVDDNGYYYILDGKLMSNKDEYGSDIIHIYGGKLLKNNGDIIDLSSKKVIGKITGFELSNNQAIISSKYEDKKINTYYYFSEVVSESESYQKEMQMFVKNNKLSIIDQALGNKKDTIIIDSYNNKNIEIYLGEDNRLHSLKDNIRIPNDFKNKNIIDITSNLNTESSYVIVKYLDGHYYGFDYRNGKKLFETKASNKISFFSYILEELNSSNSIIEDNIVEKYDKVLSVEKKLIQRPISEIKEEINNPEYVVTYNPIKEEFEVYNSIEVLNTKEGTVKSETNKIEKNYDSLKYYYGDIEVVEHNVPVIIIIISIFITILIGLWYLFFRDRNLESV